MYICIHTHIYIYMYICIYVYMYICIYVYMYLHIYVYVFIYIYLHIYTCIYVHEYIYIYMNVCIYTYMCSLYTHINHHFRMAKAFFHGLWRGTQDSRCDRGDGHQRSTCGEIHGHGNLAAICSKNWLLYGTFDQWFIDGL